MSNIDTQIKNIYAQEALEQAATLKGATDFAKRQEKLRERGDISRTTAAQVVINTIFPTAMDAIDRAFKTAAPAARASLAWGEKLGAKTCALITLNQLFNAVGKKSNVVPAASPARFAPSFKPRRWKKDTRAWLTTSTSKSRRAVAPSIAPLCCPAPRPLPALRTWLIWASRMKCWSPWA